MPLWPSSPMPPTELPIVVSDNEFQPDEQEVLQIEDLPTHEPPVDVKIVSAGIGIRTKALPNKGGASFNKVVGTAPQRLLFSDHRRARAVLMSIGQNMYIAFSSASAQDVSRMALWPANVAYTCTSDSEIWTASATATTVISVATEVWAEGE